MDNTKSNLRATILVFLRSYFKKICEFSKKYDTNSDIYNVYNQLTEIFMQFLAKYELNLVLYKGFISDANFHIIDETLIYLAQRSSHSLWDISKDEFLVNVYDILQDDEYKHKLKLQPIGGTFSFNHRRPYKVLYRYRLLFDYYMKFDNCNPYEDIFHHSIATKSDIIPIEHHAMLVRVKRSNYVMHNCFNCENMRNLTPEIINNTLVPFLDKKYFEFLYNKINNVDTQYNPLLIELDAKLGQIYSLIETC